MLLELMNRIQQDHSGTPIEFRWLCTRIFKNYNENVPFSGDSSDCSKLKGNLHHGFLSSLSEVEYYS